MKKFLIIVLTLNVISIVLVNANPQIFTGEWTEKTPAVSPKTSWSNMVYDNESDKVILYGGGSFYALVMINGTLIDKDLTYNETWVYDPNEHNWTKMHPKISPPPLLMHGMAYHEHADRIILYGGMNAYNAHYDIMGDTWVYDYNSNTWTNMNVSGPIMSSAVGMTYDSESKQIILFGGDTDYTMWSHTYAYDYETNSWENMHPTNHPPRRSSHGLTYDSESDRVILFGGSTLIGGEWEQYADTWAYDYNSNTWEEMTPAVSPSARENVKITYDSKRDRVILFGGIENLEKWSYEVPRLNDTWLYDYNSNTWEKIETETRPSERFEVNIVYASQSDTTILYGGATHADPVTYRKLFLNDTWELTLTETTETKDVSDSGLVMLAGTLGILIILRKRRGK